MSPLKRTREEISEAEEASRIKIAENNAQWAQLEKNRQFVLQVALLGTVVTGAVATGVATALGLAVMADPFKMLLGALIGVPIGFAFRTK